MCLETRVSTEADDAGVDPTDETTEERRVLGVDESGVGVDIPEWRDLSVL